MPFPTPHDAAESTGYIFEHGGSRFGFATDLGFVPRDAAELLRGCEMVVLESNHDPHMLQAGPYPYSLKMRVAGPSGHLSNPDCAVFAADLVKSGTRTLVLAHLSGKTTYAGAGAAANAVGALRGRCPRARCSLRKGTWSIRYRSGKTARPADLRRKARETSDAAFRAISASALLKIRDHRAARAALAADTL